MIILQLLTTFILFFAAIIFTFYIPGILILSFSDKSFNQDLKQILAWGVGYSLFILSSYLGSWINFPYLSLCIVFICTVYILLFRRELLTIKTPKTYWLIYLIIIFGSLSFLSMSFLSGLQTQSGFQFIGSVNGTDAVMHTARIKTQTYLFPPVYTGFTGYAVHGYHYFYDFLLSRFSLFYHFSAEDLYYRLFPLFLSIIYGCAIYIFSGLYTKKISQKAFILFLVYFASSFGFILSFFSKSVNSANGLGLVQPLELILDPSSVFAITLLLLGFYVLLQKKFSLYHAILAGSLLGLLAQLKVYAGIIAIGSLIVWYFYLFLKKKLKREHLVTVFIAILLTVITYFPNNFGVGKLLFSPFFLYDAFIRQNPLFSPWNWEMRMFIYREHNNITHIFFMYIVAGILFWILTLGLRIVIFLKTPSIFTKNFWADEAKVLLTVCITVPLAIASLFVQSISIFDTVQFLWVVGILLCIPAGIILGNLFERMPKFIKIFFVVCLIFVSYGAYAYDETIYLLRPNFTTFTTGQMNVVRIISQHITQNNFLVVAPAYEIDKYGKRKFVYYPAPLFSSLTSRRTYYEYEIPEFPQQNKVMERKNQVEKITLSMEKCDGSTVKNIMQKINSPYLVTLMDFPCRQIPHLTKIKAANSWTFWQVN